LVQPLSTTVTEGGTAAFSAAWSGSGPFLHRWRRTSVNPATTVGVLAPTNGLSRLVLTNGYIIASPTNTVLVLTNVSAASLGAYDVVVSNAVGQLASEDGMLTMLADTDRDGLPDTWETGRTGFDINNNSDALRDDDSDGINNAKEYLAGTDYLSNQSYLKVQILQPPVARLTFPAAALKTYTLQYTDGLNPINWKTLDIEPARTNARTVTIVDPAAASTRQYRMATPAQP
jgi:hypothetical protein